MSKLSEADKAFSRYQRLRLSDELGLLKCVTCGSWDEWKKMHWGHWKVRSYMDARFDYRNGGPQCPRCNCIGGGMAGRMQEYISKAHGFEAVAEINWDGASVDVDIDKIGRVYRRLLRRELKMRST